MSSKLFTKPSTGASAYQQVQKETGGSMKIEYTLKKFIENTLYSDVHITTHAGNVVRIMIDRKDKEPLPIETVVRWFAEENTKGGAGG